MTKVLQHKSWIERKFTKKSLLEAIEEVAEKLSLGEQLIIMRTHKFLPFILPNQMEKEVKSQAKKEHKTTSEFIQGALHQYMNGSTVSKTQDSLSQSAKKKKTTVMNVEKAGEEIKAPAQRAM